MLTRTMRSLLAAALAVPGIACDDVLGGGDAGRKLGILQFEVAQPAAATNHANPAGTIRWTVPPGDGVAYPPSVIEAPDTVNIDTNFQVRVYTVGVSGCWRADGVEHTRSAKSVEITPFDTNSGAEVCTQVLGYLAHPMTLKLDQKGEWTLRVKGRRVRGYAADIPVEAERTIVVR